MCKYLVASSPVPFVFFTMWLSKLAYSTDHLWNLLLASLHYLVHILRLGYHGSRHHCRALYCRHYHLWRVRRTYYVLWGVDLSYRWFCNISILISFFCILLTIFIIWRNVPNFFSSYIFIFWSLLSISMGITSNISVSILPTSKAPVT